MNDHYLITGATGSLGREVIPRLLERNRGAEASLLIRSRDAAEADRKRDELERYLAFYGHAALIPRLSFVRGDVERPALGLSEADARHLRERATHVIHAAASIHLSQPIDDARAVHVGGTAEALAFARACPRLRRFAHVSTAYVAGDRGGPIGEDELDRGQGFLNAYERTKFEAERLVRAEAERIPVTIFRPSIIVGDSRDGHTCNFQTLYRPLRLIAAGRLAEIRGDATAPLDIVPVDYVADCIASLALAPAPSGRTYHVTAGPGRSIPVGLLVAALACRAGVPWPRFVAGGAAPARGTERLDAFFSYLVAGKQFDDSALRRDLGRGAPRCPDPHGYLEALFTFCEAADWGRALPWERPAAEAREEEAA